MNEYLLMMHNDGGGESRSWKAYLDRLRQAGRFAGYSAIGDGFCMAKTRPPAAPTPHLVSYVRVLATSLRDAAQLVEGNPVFESGGTVEVRFVPTPPSPIDRVDSCPRPLLPKGYRAAQ